VTTEYIEVISLVERLHRHFLEVVKLELDGLGIHDINNVQGLMLFNIGDAEMTVGELILRGCCGFRRCRSVIPRSCRSLFRHDVARLRGRLAGSCFVAGSGV